jgi:predicted HTH domain antitoxin
VFEALFPDPPDLDAIPMTELRVEVPDEILLAQKTDAATFSREIRVLAAVKLLELDRLTSGRAAQLAGMPRVEFLMQLERYRVFPLAAELEELEDALARSHH